MKKFERKDLWSLEKYASVRNEFRQKVMAHKKHRQLPIGPNATLYFEDTLTIHYQIQEMLRIERIFEAVAIEDELAAYNPLLPDGSNWKAVFMIEFADETERRMMLAKMKGIEDRLWMKVGGYDKIVPFADEDMERSNADKTSAVHFLRFELSEDMVASFKEGANLATGIDHADYNHTVATVSDEVRTSLLQDLD